MAPQSLSSRAIKAASIWRFASLDHWLLGYFATKARNESGLFLSKDCHCCRSSGLGAGAASGTYAGVARLAEDAVNVRASDDSSCKSRFVRTTNSPGPKVRVSVLVKNPLRESSMECSPGSNCSLICRLALARPNSTPSSLIFVLVSAPRSSKRAGFGVSFTSNTISAALPTATVTGPKSL